MENETLQYFVEAGMVIIKMISPTAEAIKRVLDTLEHNNGETVKMFWEEGHKNLYLQIVNASSRLVNRIIANVQGAISIPGFEEEKIDVPKLENFGTEISPDEIRKKICEPEEVIDPKSGLTFDESLKKFGTITGVRFYVLSSNMIRGRNRNSMIAKSTEAIRQDLRSRNPELDSFKSMENFFRLYRQIGEDNLNFLQEKKGTSIESLLKDPVKYENDIRVMYGGFLSILKRRFRVF